MTLPRRPRDPVALRTAWRLVVEHELSGAYWYPITFYLEDGHTEDEAIMACKENARDRARNLDKLDTMPPAMQTILNYAEQGISSEEIYSVQNEIDRSGMVQTGKVLVKQFGFFQPVVPKRRRKAIDQYSLNPWRQRR